MHEIITGIEKRYSHQVTSKQPHKIVQILMRPCINVINTWSPEETRSKCTYLRISFLHKEFDEANYIRIYQKKSLPLTSFMLFICPQGFTNSKFWFFFWLVHRFFWCKKTATMKFASGESKKYFNPLVSSSIFMC